MSLLYGILKCGGGSNTIVNSFNRTVFVGDSILAAYACRPENLSDIFLTPAEISAGKQAFNLAVPGHTVLQQQTVWTNDTQKATYDLIIVQLGLNDIAQNQGELVGAIITRYQTLIDTINAGKKAGAKILISCMTPANTRWSLIPTDPTIAQAKWVALNNSIMNTYSTNITGVDYRNNGHLAALTDANGGLTAVYDCGDKVHTTSAGNVIIKNAMRTALGI